MPSKGNLSATERFWQNVEKTDGCWIWNGYRAKLGYGRFRGAPKGKKILAHRFSYQMHCSEIPEGLVLDHLCRNPSCVNPAHLEPVTSRENTMRGLINDWIHRDRCLAGHDFNEENTRYDARGHRVCRKCQCRWQAEARQRRVERVGPRVRSIKTHCKHGHEFTIENTRIAKTGQRCCRTCARLTARERYAPAAQKRQREQY